MITALFLLKAPSSTIIEKLLKQMNRLHLIFVYVSEGGGRVLDEYIEKHGRRLYGLCLTLCQNPDDADDLYQETWLKVHQKFEQYNPVYKFEGWLTRICVNIYKDQLRKKKISLIFDLFDSQETKDAILESASAEKKEDFSDLRAAVQRLPEKLRITVVLYYFKELDVGETATILNIPKGTVKSRLSKSRILLKEMINDAIEL